MVFKNIAQAKKRSEGYFCEYEAKRRETDPNWKANKARVARESYQRHKNDKGAQEKRRARYEQYKNTDWYEEASKRARISMSPVAQKPRQIGDIARARQAKHLTTKLAHNGRKNLKQRRSFPSVHGAYKMILNTDSTHD